MSRYIVAPVRVGQALHICIVRSLLPKVVLTGEMEVEAVM